MCVVVIVEKICSVFFGSPEGRKQISTGKVVYILIVRPNKNDKTSAKRREEKRGEEKRREEKCKASIKKKIRSRITEMNHELNICYAKKCIKIPRPAFIQIYARRIIL